jgi:hypothetical protein
MKPKNYNSNTLYERILNVLNESEDDKYTHIGYGRFKLKGKEDDKNTPVFIRK